MSTEVAALPPQVQLFHPEQAAAPLEPTASARARDTSPLGPDELELHTGGHCLEIEIEVPLSGRTIQLMYSGPDTHDELVVVPGLVLFCDPVVDACVQPEVDSCATFHNSCKGGWSAGDKPGWSEEKIQGFTPRLPDTPVLPRMAQPLPGDWWMGPPLEGFGTPQAPSGPKAALSTLGTRRGQARDLSAVGSTSAGFVAPPGAGGFAAVAADEEEEET